MHDRGQSCLSQELDKKRDKTAGVFSVL